MTDNRAASSGLRDVQRVLRGYAVAARAAARDLGEAEGFRAAALRGKARGYDEAADLIESALRGGRLRRKWRIRRGVDPTLAFTHEAAPRIQELGGEVCTVAFNAATRVLHVEIVAHSWDQRRSILNLLTSWQIAQAEPVDVSPTILDPADAL